MYLVKKKKEKKLRALSESSCSSVLSLLPFVKPDSNDDFSVVGFLLANYRD